MTDMLDDLRLSPSSDLPLHKQVEAAIEAVIRDGKWSEEQAIPSPMKIASHLSISYLTIRRSINRLIERQVLTAKPGLGTFVAPGSGHRRIAWVCGMDLYHGAISSAYTQHLSTTRELVAPLGWRLEPVWLSNERPEDTHAFLNSGRAEGYAGFIFTGLQLDHPMLEHVKRNGLPFVNITHLPLGPYSVYVRQRQGYDLTFEILRQRNCRNVAVMVQELFAQEVRDAADAARMPIELMDWGNIAYAGECEKSGYVLTRRYLETHDLPDALVFLDDIFARGATRALLEMHDTATLSQTEVVIMGNPKAIVPMGLRTTLIGVPLEEMDQAAVRILRNRLEDKYDQPDEQYVLYRIYENHDDTRPPRVADTKPRLSRDGDRPRKRARRTVIGARSITSGAKA
ncbi:MAG: GntR family transcriptional regulator [Phycisphaeraceae bacterium]|nr:GntR family transcriptional regulator [Phycisphaeraceae bacterium]